jgi:hypothetical protein
MPDGNDGPQPHVATLYRPRPLRRSRTAPSQLPIPNGMQDGSLSPALEVDELHLDETDQGLTPTPSPPASPSTPKSASRDDPPMMKHHHGSWDSKAGSGETPWEMITIGKSIEPGDILDDELLHEDDIDDEDWLEKCKPQVAIARSMSVTKTSRKVRVKPVVHSTARSISGSSKGSSTVELNGPTGKRAEMEKELQKELFGDRNINDRDEKILENKALTPVMHLVGGESSRKSVWGTIECI